MSLRIEFRAAALGGASATFQAPNAQCTLDYEGNQPCVNNDIDFSGVGSTDPDGDDSKLVYEWDFNNDGNTDATGINVSYSFSTPGQKMVVLTVTDEDGKSSTCTQTFEVIECCEACESSELLAKYEFTCVETDPDTGECIASDFVLKKGDGSLITYTSGNYESKVGESGEPMVATFGTDYCSVWAVVKAGRELDVQEAVQTDNEVCVKAPGKHAISFVAFYCSEEAAQAAADAFPSRR